MGVMARRTRPGSLPKGESAPDAAIICARCRRLHAYRSAHHRSSIAPTMLHFCRPCWRDLQELASERGISRLVLLKDLYGR